MVSDAAEAPRGGERMLNIPEASTFRHVAMSSPSGAAPAPAPLASKALSESFARLRFLDTSLLVWQQQRQRAATAPPRPSSYLSRSQSAWYSSYGNSAVVVRDKSCLEEHQGRSRVCALM
ncbi:putative uncharacterized protein BRD3OS [Phycodurus eques]|uniref:putative uncharacterized protein BRD3OS n=1 Tax=Phycodurus eques TaxID=693459 RepID=UPI002ACE89E3|nr:putative uncharacterized protein BRD3OS [Phycodurus eques]XP_061527215.1 putative uncharacterized protein BRD3OS [Phycodurus eques]